MRKLLLCGLLFFIAACGGDPPVTHGKVIDHSFTPAHNEEVPRTYYRTETYTDEECSSQYDYKGNYVGQTCYPVTRTRSVPYTVWETEHVPDRYRLQLQDCKPEGTKGENGKNLTTDERCREGWLNVSETEYSNYPLGSYYGGQS